MEIVYIGSGNVATHMASALKKSGNSIVQVFSRTLENAKVLASKTGAEAIDDINQIYTKAALYIFSVKDDLINEIARMMPVTSGVWVHTAGSIPIEALHENSKKWYSNSGYGVIYPLQTFSKTRDINFSDIPVFVEGSNPEIELFLENVAKTISNNVQHLTGEKRKYLHLSAVFANNFSNHMYTLASRIIEDEGIDFDVLKPLINETVAKVMEMKPEEAQTGPAIRLDDMVMAKHIELLKTENIKEIYNLISKSIHNQSL